MTTNILLDPNSVQASFLATADEKKVYQLSKTDLDALATSAIGANLSINFNLVEEFNETAGFSLELRKSSKAGALVASTSSSDNPLFFQNGELKLSANIEDDAQYFLIVKSSAADKYTDSQFEVTFDEIPTFGGVVTDSIVASKDIMALEDAYIGKDLKNTAEFSSISDKISFLMDLNATDDDRDITISYSGPSTDIEVFKVTDTGLTTAKNLTNATGSTANSQSIGLVYTVSEDSNIVSVTRADGKDFTATFSIGSNTGVTSLPDAETSSSSNGISSATFDALLGDAAVGDTVTLTISADNEVDVTRSVTVASTTTLNAWVDDLVALFAEDKVFFTANETAETLKVVFSNSSAVGEFSFNVTATDDPTATDEQNTLADRSLASSQSPAPTLRIADKASSDFKISQKVGAETNVDVTFTSGNVYKLSDFISVDGDFDAVYVVLEKINSSDQTPTLTLTINDQSSSISSNSASPTILSKSDFLNSTFTAGSAGLDGFNLTVFARKLTGQNKSESFTVDSDVSTWFASSVLPNQTDSSAIFQAKVGYLDTAISAKVLDTNKQELSSSDSLLEGEKGYLELNLSNFIKSENQNTDLSINLSVATNDISFVDPSTGATNKSKTVVISDSSLQIPFWIISDPDLIVTESVALRLEVIGAANSYGTQLSSLITEQVTFNISELIPSLSTRYTNANALLPSNTDSTYQYMVSLENYSDVKSVDNSILLKPLASSNAAKFQIEAYTLSYDVNAASLKITPFKGSSTVNVSVWVDDVITSNIYSNGEIDIAKIYSKNVKIEISADDLPTAIYSFSAPVETESTEAKWTNALKDAFDGFKFEAADGSSKSEIEVSIYSLAGADDLKASTIIEHELSYNGKTFDSADLSIPNVQVTTNLAANETWTPSGSGADDFFGLSSLAVNVEAGGGNDTLTVSKIPYTKSSYFDGEEGTDTVSFSNNIGSYKIELASSGDVKVTELSSSGNLYLQNTEILSFGGVSYNVTRVDGSLSAYSRADGNDLYIVSTNTPTVLDSGKPSDKDIVITSASYDSSKYQGVEEVILSGEQNLTATLSSAAIIYGNAGNNTIATSSQDDVIYMSAGTDFIQDNNSSDSDTFVMENVESSYTYYQSNDLLFITGAAGTSILENIERIAFSNDTSSAKLMSELSDTAPSSSESLEEISVSVSGNFIEGTTLTANFIDSGSNNSIGSSKTFNWFETGSNDIIGTDQTFKVKQEDIGKSIYVIATYLDAAGSIRKSQSSDQKVTYFNDDISGVVSLSGKMEVGEKILAEVLKFSDLDFIQGSIPSVVSYQWYSDGTEISGANDQKLEITQALKTTSLSVKVGFLNKYNEIEYLTSNGSDFIFDGRDAASLSLSSNDLFVVNSGEAVTDKSIGEIKSEFSDFFNGEEAAQFVDNINQSIGSGDIFDRLKVEVTTSSSVISDPQSAQKFNVLGNGSKEQNTVLFLDMSSAASGVAVDAASVQNISFKGVGTITTDETDQHIFTDASDQIITTGKGNDSVFSGGGDDTLSLGLGFNVAYTGTGNDTVFIPFSFNEKFVAFASENEVNIDNGVTAYSVFNAEKFNFNDEVTKSITDLSALTNKNFDPLGSVSIEGQERIGNQLSAIDTTFDANGIKSETVLYQWFRGEALISSEKSSTYTLTEADIGYSISVKKIFEDNLENENTIESEATGPIQSLRVSITGTSNADHLTSTSDSESFVGGAGADAFIFKNSEPNSQGDDIILDFVSLEDSLIINGYNHLNITRSLNKNGDDYFVFTEDSGESSVTVRNDTSETSLKLKDSAAKSLAIDGTDFEVNSQGAFTMQETVNFTEVKVNGLNNLKEDLLKQGDEIASDPINLSDVLVQLKHIVGLRSLKGAQLQAGDVNNDSTIDLTDVLMCLKHIVNLRPINSFDLVTDNGFAVNSLDQDSVGNLTLVINGDADQSHADWDFVT